MYDKNFLRTRSVIVIERLTIILSTTNCKLHGMCELQANERVTVVGEVGYLPT